MKTYLLTTIAFLLITMAAQAQSINLGIKGGLNAYTIKGDNSDDFDPKYSFHVGLLGHIHMSDEIAIQPEIYYSAQGTQYKSNGSDLKLNLNYVNVPLLLQYMFDNGFRLQAGAQLGILASAKSEIGGTTTDVKSSFKGTDIAGVVGMSYVKPSTGLGFDIRYNYGVTNISENDNIESFNRGFQVGIFYLFKHRD
ncbi:MAG: PorT family protein [Cyclobacteriaceae bacterium]|jgi:hypothetical protein|nr:PorT family protein [Cyclobacteriaceae bacterium]